jgi:hypothetical protein
VPEIWRRYGASISGAHRRIKSANFADLVSGLKRLRSAPRAASRPIAADVQASGLPQAAARGTLNALAVEAFNDLLKKHGNRRVMRAIDPQWRGAPGSLGRAVLRHPTAGSSHGSRKLPEHGSAA